MRLFLMPSLSVDKADLMACRALLRGGSKSFFAASLLLPGRVRDSATALYAFCRVADDAIDLGDDPLAAVVRLNDRLDAAYAGAPEDGAIDRAFAAAVSAHGIPKALPAALIEGLAWDSEGRRYESFEALLDYAARVAGAVGVMMALVMGVRDRESLARAADLGTAMQLTNIARDVGEDAAAGRFFLPGDWCEEAGVDVAAFLARPVFSVGLGGVVKRLLDAAEELYARAESGIARLPLGCRTGIAAARRIYAAIGSDVAAHGYDSVTRRARVPGPRKVLLAGRAVADAVMLSAGAGMPALAANAFLLEWTVFEPAVETRALIKLLNMFERLERSQRAAALAEAERSFV
jgi:phytoene synthase